MMNVTSQSCRRSQLAKLAILALQFSLLLGAEKFYADDPLEAMPAPLEVEKLETRKLNDVYDLFENTFGAPEKSNRKRKRPRAQRSFLRKRSTRWERCRTTRLGLRTASAPGP